MRVVLADEEIAGDGEAVRQRAGHDRQAERLAAQRRILGEELLAPALPQRLPARRRRVVVRIRRSDVDQVSVHRRQVHRTALLGRDADRRVELLGLRLGFGRLRQDPFREVETLAERRQHREDGRCRLLEALVQLLSERVGLEGHGTAPGL
jgi:hypothetical protein